MMVDPVTIILKLDIYQTCHFTVEFIRLGTFGSDAIFENVCVAGSMSLILFVKVHVFFNFISCYGESERLMSKK